MPRSKHDVDISLRKKGFVHTEGDHDFFIYHTLDGLKTHVHTKTSHGKSFDISDHLLSQMAKQVKLTSAEFRSLIDCPLSREDYERILRTDGHLS